MEWPKALEEVKLDAIEDLEMQLALARSLTTCSGKMAKQHRAEEEHSKTAMTFDKLPSEIRVRIRLMVIAWEHEQAAKKLAETLNVHDASDNEYAARLYPPMRVFKLDPAKMPGAWRHWQTVPHSRLTALQLEPVEYITLDVLRGVEIGQQRDRNDPLARSQLHSLYVLYPRFTSEAVTPSIHTLMMKLAVMAHWLQGCGEAPAVYGTLNAPGPTVMRLDTHLARADYREDENLRYATPTRNLNRKVGLMEYVDLDENTLRRASVSRSGPDKNISLFSVRLSMAAMRRWLNRVNVDHGRVYALDSTPPGHHKRSAARMMMFRANILRERHLTYRV